MNHPSSSDSAREAPFGDKFSAPQQGRSREAVKRVLDAFDELLRDRPYQEIHLSEIAAISGTSTSSIYARFKDKRAILLVLHREKSAEAFEFLRGLYTDATGAHKTPAQAINSIFSGFRRWYSMNRNVLHAILAIDEPMIFVRALEVFRGVSASYTDVFVRAHPNADPLRVARNFSVIVGLLSATFEQQTMFGQTVAEEFDPEFEELRRLATNALAEAIGEGDAGEP